MSARARATELANTYQQLDREAKRRFLTVLAEDFGTKASSVHAGIAAYQAASDASTRVAAEAVLRDALTPPRRTLLTRFNELEGGVKFLVDLRADLLPISSQSPELSGLDDDLKELLVSWFDFGFLELARITWRSPAILLSKLIEYEAVHAIRSWEDLRNRLHSDRRCYALFHPSMPDEPLAFLEVALCQGTARSVQSLLDENAPHVDPNRADTAVFYSITSPQNGLRGISFGEYLIKRAVDELSHDLPRLARYVTLSPIPGFRVWLENRLARTPEALEVDGVPAQLDTATVRKMLEERSWATPSSTAGQHESTLLALCARYFAERRADGQPIDPVARFHLSNGARLDHLNWLGDISPKGIRQSLGLMVNYSYDLEDIDANHEGYAQQREIAVSPAILALMNLANAPTGEVKLVSPLEQPDSEGSPGKPPAA